MYATLFDQAPLTGWLNPIHEEKPVDIQAVLNRAELLIQADYLEQAMEELDTVLQHEPGNSYALFVRYCCKLKLGLFDEADNDLLLLNSVNSPATEA